MAVAAVAIAAAFPRAQSRLNAAEPVWNRVDTPNFVVIGTACEKSLAETGLQFEGFREALSRIVSPTATATAVPTIVIVFPSDKAFEPFRPMYNGKRVDLGGLFLSREDVNYVLLGPSRSDESWRVVFHEYTHLLVNNVVPNLPPWLNEGLAEYYSSFELGHNGRQVLLGKPIAGHYRTLAAEPWLTIPELVATTHASPHYNEGSRRSVFYAESWMLTHMLMHGEPDRRPKLAAYVDAIASNMTPQDAWDKVFAGDDITNALRRYANRPAVWSRQYTLSEQIARASGLRVPLSPSAAAATFAELCLANGDKACAAERFTKALELEPQSVRAAFGAAAAAGQPGSVTSLAPSDDWLTDYMTAAALVHGTVRARGSAAAAIPLLEHAARQHPVPNMYGLIAEASGDEALLSEADIEGLERAHASAPARDDYSFELARALAIRGRYADARNVLGTLIGHPHWDRTRDSAMRVMRWVVEREERAKALAAPAAASPASDTPAGDTERAASENPPPTSPAEPERDVQPLYRDVQKGEQRAEGLLERVDCNPGKPAIVTVRYRTNVVQYQAAKLTDIEFITYQSTKAGRFSCGPRVPPDRIYLTWKPGAGGVNTVVAVEFLAVKK